MSQRITQFLIFSLLLLLFAGCSFFKKATAPGESPTDMKNPDEVMAADQKIYDEAVAKRDPALCAQIQNALQQKQCNDVILLQEAALTKDSAQCDKITDPAIKLNCQDDLWFNEAGEKRDASICDRIKSDEKQSLCRQNVQGLKDMKIPPNP